MSETFYLTEKGMKLRNKVAVVTGGGQGLGRAICFKLAEQGAKIVVADINPEISEETANLARDAHGAETFVKVTDLNRPEQIVDLANTVRSRYGAVDILVNNSGIAGPRSTIEDLSLEDWNANISINLTGMFLVSKYFMPLLKATNIGGSIVNIASTAGMRVLIYRLPYTTTKAAVIAFSKNLAAEVGEFNIRVNSVCPGAVAGPRQHQVLENVAAQTGKSLDQVIKEKKADAALNRFVAPAAIGDAVVFLCCPEAELITGTNLNVSAGLVFG